MNEIRKLMESLEKIEENYYGGGHLSTDVRQVTNKLHELMDEGVLDPRAVADAALTYLSESDVAEMARSNELIYDDDEEDFGESVEVIGEAGGIDNDEVERHLVQAAHALAKDAVKQSVGVYDEEGPGTGKFASGAQNVHQYVEWAAPRFLSPDYQKDIMYDFIEMYADAVRMALQDYSENRR